jgi:hypothetical protein
MYLGGGGANCSLCPGCPMGKDRPWLRTIGQVYWDVMSCRSAGVLQRQTQIQQQRHIPGHLHPLQNTCSHLKFRRSNEKYGRKRKILLGLIETVRLICCRGWGRDCSSRGQLPTKQNTSAITSFLLILYLSHFSLFCCCFASFVSNFPLCQSSDTQICTHTADCWLGPGNQNIGTADMLSCLSNEPQWSLYVPQV